MLEQNDHLRIGFMEETLVKKLSDYCSKEGLDGAFKRTESVFNKDDCRVILPIASGKILSSRAFGQCQDILRELERFPEVAGLVPYRIELSFVRPNSKVYPHIDKIFFHSKCRRVHVVLKSEGSFYSSIEQDGTLNTCRMYENEVWVINNRKMHTAENKSSSIRIHMIIDYASKEDHLALLEDQFLANKIQ